MRQIFFFSLCLTVMLANDFITKEEYAKMLYHNPRGIGCDRCHGEDGRGLELGRYKDGNRTVIIKAPDITKLTFTKFRQALITKDHRLMPQYFLTNKEIKTLYYYLTKKRK
ncbi:c-type cytochrome [Nitratiruptor tergarcus]|uniref:Cytochrome c domain-containing protein n=1 Tax=Nitratiruptor tergarcus DSM 16512 TaxID=1069081 RepID=A0A1W1WT32_9BACT|nr:cytochrome C oxidase subunit III [Nitratiruptor tergarcus]SMC09454.1 hypothetical protein SAMN05660197_1262 [Nitratiruptor tergarcus DSM 16512]